jgi:hypothetical protein
MSQITARTGPRCPGDRRTAQGTWHTGEDGKDSGAGNPVGCRLHQTGAT